MPLKVWNGSSFITANDAKVWNGSTWKAPVSGRVWNGSSWVVFLNQVNINDHTVQVNVGGTFNGAATASLTYKLDGTVEATEFRLNEGLDSFAALDGASFVGVEVVTGEWLRNGNASDFQIRITRSGAVGTISGASFGTWTTMSGDVTISVDDIESDSSDTFTVQFRDVTTSTQFDSCTITLIANAAGIN